MIGATCRLAAGLVLPVEQQRAAAAAAATAAATAAAAAAAAAPAAAPLGGNGERKIKIATILDQTSDVETVALGEPEILA
eukprot:11807769-Heterocapsa_arctica.AAC.1